MNVFFSGFVLVDGDGVHVLVFLRHLICSSVCLADLELSKLLIFWLHENTEIQELTLGLIFGQSFGGIILSKLVNLLTDVKVVDQKVRINLHDLGVVLRRNNNPVFL